MAKIRLNSSADDDYRPEMGSGQSPPWPPGRRDGGRVRPWSVLLLVLVALVLAYPVYFWTVRRIVVPPNHVLVLLKKNGSQSLPGDQVIIPRPPTPPQAGDSQFEQKRAEWQKLQKEWEEKYGDCNGILEQVYGEGTYFAFSPFDYEREIFDISDSAIVKSGDVGIVIRKFGKRLAGAAITPEGKLVPGQVLADSAANQAGPVSGVLNPGRYNEYANPYAYEIKPVNPVWIEPGHRGVVTLMAAQQPTKPNSYLVGEGERGVQKRTEEEGFRYVNPYEKRITPISVRSERFEMSGKEAIRFPSYDSFEIQLEGVVEWRVKKEELPKLYVEYGEGAELIPLLSDRVILPYARSFCRLVGSRYHARDFISGNTKLVFQKEFEKELRAACEAQGIEVLQALVRDIVPPAQIKEPINEREIAKQRIETIKQQILVAKSAADLAKQEEMSLQNKALGEASRKMIVIEQEAEQQRATAITKAEQELEVAKLLRDAAVSQAKALTTQGEADAYTVLVKKQAEAEPLQQQIQAFGGGGAYAQYFFYQKVAPSVKSILTDTSGTFGEVFRQFLAQPAAGSASQIKQAEVQP